MPIASVASSGRPSMLRLKVELTVFATSSLVAFPFPVIFFFITFGEIWCIGGFSCVCVLW